MIYDGQLQFTGSVPGTFSTDTPTTGVQFSTNTIDLGSNSDFGIGDNSTVKVSAICTTAFTGGTSIQVGVQGSVDNSTFITLETGPTIAEAALIPGVHLLDIDLPRLAGAMVNGPGATMGRPRYLRLQYTNSGTHSTGAIFAGLVLDRQDMITSIRPRNRRFSRPAPDPMMAEPWQLPRMLRQAKELAEDPASTCDPEAHELRLGHAFLRLKGRIWRDDWPEWAERFVVANNLARDVAEIEQKIERYKEYKRAPWPTARSEQAFPAEPAPADGQAGARVIAEDDVVQLDWPPAEHIGPLEIGDPYGPYPDPLAPFTAWEVWASRMSFSLTHAWLKSIIRNP